jgi:hypothetical protein
MILRVNTVLSVCLLSLMILRQVSAQQKSTILQRDASRVAPAVTRADDTPKSALSPDEWRNVDSAIQRGLTFLAAQQQPDGSFPTDSVAQPGVTSLCVLAFMAHGHNPGNGPYGDRLDRAIRYIADCQKRSGLIVLNGFDGPEIDRTIGHDIGSSGTYDHAISSLTLCELYGMNPSKNAPRLKKVIEKSIAATLQMQHWEKEMPVDEGGWRYINDFDVSDSDLSVTGWHLMFLRSARNAGFEVPDKTIAEAVAYVRRTFSRQYDTFQYTIDRGDVRTRAMTGAGILALGHAGFHNSAEAKHAAEHVLGYSFDAYNGNGGFKRERYHYGLFMCCQGMYQMGNPYWEQFFPRTVRAVLAHQQPNGSWDTESWKMDRRYGKSYTTALVILALGAPNQFLPIFQR